MFTEPKHRHSTLLHEYTLKAWIHTESTQNSVVFRTPTRHSSLLDLVVEQTSTRRVFCLRAVGESCTANTSLSSSVSWASELRVRKRQRVASGQGSTTTRTYLWTAMRRRSCKILHAWTSDVKSKWSLSKSTVNEITSLPLNGLYCNTHTHTYRSTLYKEPTEILLNFSPRVLLEDIKRL